MNLLHLDSSIQGGASASRALSAALVRHLRQAHPTMSYRYRDLVAEPLPHLTLEELGTADAAAVPAEFKAADIVVIGAALYNFGVPTQLKAWIDRILIAGQTFRYTAEGSVGLAGGKRVLIGVARGGLYHEGAPAAALEHTETYLRGVFGFIGIADPAFVVAEGLGLSEEARRTAIDAALARAEEVAGTIG